VSRGDTEGATLPTANRQLPTRARRSR